MRNTSLWSEFVRNANFTAVNETKAIQELVDQITELKAILNHLDELNVSCFYYFIKVSKQESIHYKAEPF